MFKLIHFSNRKFLVQTLIVFSALFSILCAGCGSSAPTTQEVGQSLSISNSSVAGSGFMVNTYNNSAVTNTFNIPAGSVTVTSNMSVYPGSTGYFSVTFPSSATFNYSFGSVAITGQAANPTFTSSGQTFN